MRGFFGAVYAAARFFKAAFFGVADGVVVDADDAPDTVLVASAGADVVADDVPALLAGGAPDPEAAAALDLVAFDGAAVVADADAALVAFDAAGLTASEGATLTAHELVELRAEAP